MLPTGHRLSVIALTPVWVDTDTAVVILAHEPPPHHLRTELGTMALLDWILVVIGIAIAFTGSWIQLHPERISPSQDLQFDSSSLAQIRRLGACFLFMGDFFACQMTVDLIRLPWWMGTLGGMVTGIAAVLLVSVRSRRRQSHRRFVQQSHLPEKVLELR
jgi:hypothetical protein